MEYIERETVEQIIAAQCGECADACLEFDGIQPDCNQCLLHGAAKAIKTIPAADVRPVVTCADCKYNKREVTDLWGNDAIQCITGQTHGRNWFCADGKKREEN